VRFTHLKGRDDVLELIARRAAPGEGRQSFEVKATFVPAIFSI
jgi:hypothetical protein